MIQWFKRWRERRALRKLRRFGPRDGQTVYVVPCPEDAPIPCKVHHIVDGRGRTVILWAEYKHGRRILPIDLLGSEVYDFFFEGDGDERCST